MASRTLGYLGNFEGATWTTENHRAGDFRELGWRVVELQENKTNARQLREIMPKLDLLLYSHTHSPAWEIEGLKDVLKEYKEAGVPTASVHLDTFAGLEREKDVGREAMWFTEYIFTADGSPEMNRLWEMTGAKFEGQQLHWLKPGVYSKECYMAEPDRKRFPHDIIFVGSKQYHSEYPFRPKLVDWLKQTYGERFGHYGADGIALVRGNDLNTLYASSQVAVGDSCFGGRARYWSDRVTETTGRGGFLIHPVQKGMDNEGVAHYRQGDLGHLKATIDYWLMSSSRRKQMRKKGHEWTKNNATYKHRASEMLSIMGLA